MRDAQWIFGQISLATKDTQVYSADSVKLGDIDTRVSGKFANHKSGKAAGYEVVFSADAAFNAADSYIPIVQDSADGSSWADLVTGAQTAVGPAKGARTRLALPLEHRKYLRASVMPKSTGTLTACTVTAWVEAGPN